jgi:predicted TIM-barrel fold metal-dependent hydrolase
MKRGVDRDPPGHGTTDMNIRANEGTDASNVAEVGADIVNIPVDNEWVEQHDEAALEPDLPIIDPHHHMWDRPANRYMPPDLIADTTNGHNVVATVFIETGAMYRSRGPLELRPAGETECMAAFAAGWPREPSQPKICAGIVAHAELSRGAAIRELLEMHIEVGRGFVRGIRQNMAWDPTPSIQLPPLPPRKEIAPHLPVSPLFREGFACLAPLGLSFDAWLYQPQLPELLDLVRTFPDTSIVIDHVGGPVRVGPYVGRSDALFAEWKAIMAEFARCPNVSMKIGGLGMRSLGFDFRGKPKPPTSEQLAELWRPYVETCIELFGTDRSMFESNFPVDKGYYGYNPGWNAFKRLTAGASADEKRDLFYGTAKRIYRLDV